MSPHVASLAFVLSPSSLPLFISLLPYHSSTLQGRGFTRSLRGSVRPKLNDKLTKLQAKHEAELELLRDMKYVCVVCSVVCVSTCVCTLTVSSSMLCIISPPSSFHDFHFSCRKFTRQRSYIEKEYSEKLQRLVQEYSKKEIQDPPKGDRMEKR